MVVYRRRRAKRNGRFPHMSQILRRAGYETNGYGKPNGESAEYIDSMCRPSRDYLISHDMTPDKELNRKAEIAAAQKELAEYQKVYTPGNLSKKQYYINRAKRKRIYGEQYKGERAAKRT
jgi:hypothetical protein